MVNVAVLGILVSGVIVTLTYKHKMLVDNMILLDTLWQDKELEPVWCVHSRSALPWPDSLSRTILLYKCNYEEHPITLNLQYYRLYFPKWKC